MLKPTCSRPTWRNPPVTSRQYSPLVDRRAVEREVVDEPRAARRSPNADRPAREERDGADDDDHRRSTRGSLRIVRMSWTFVRCLAHSGQRMPTGVGVMQSGQIGRPHVEQETPVSRFGMAVAGLVAVPAAEASISRLTVQRRAAARRLRARGAARARGHAAWAMTTAGASVPRCRRWARSVTRTWSTSSTRPARRPSRVPSRTSNSAFVGSGALGRALEPHLVDAAGSAATGSCGRRASRGRP